MSDYNRKVFIGNVPYKCNNLEFENLFKAEPGFKKAELQRDNISQNTKGYGFVEFECQEDAMLCMKKSFKLGDRELRLSEYKNKPTDNKKIFVKDLDDTPLKDFEDFFKKYGKVLKSYIITNRTTGESKGTGIVEFENEESYNSALDDEDTYINGRKISIYPYKEKFIETKNNNGQFTNSYINGFNAGYASGFNAGYKEGYSRGFADSKVGKASNPTGSYLNKVIKDINQISNQNV